MLGLLTLGLVEAFDEVLDGVLRLLLDERSHHVLEDVVNLLFLKVLFELLLELHFRLLDV